MKTREVFYMVDLETTGTRRNKEDKILQVAAVPVVKGNDGFFRQQVVEMSPEDFKDSSISDIFNSFGRKRRKPFNRKVHYIGKPETIFAKQHMAALYAECNTLDPINDDIQKVLEDFRAYIHEGSMPTPHGNTPKRMIGWNASNFDLEFLFDFGMTRSHYVEVDGKDMLVGDMHYQVYEIGGLLHGMVSITGLDHQLVKSLALAACPEHVKFDVKGISHDGLDDCYYQLNLLNGLIALGRSGVTVKKLQGEG